MKDHVEFNRPARLYYSQVMWMTRFVLPIPGRFSIMSMNDTEIRVTFSGRMGQLSGR